ncbi:hypothetical protein ACFE04_027310 [Oxalis oulophora]
MTSTTNIFKPLTLSYSSSTTPFLSIFPSTTKPYLQIPKTPLKLTLSHSSSSPLFLSLLKPTKTHFSSLLTFSLQDETITTLTLETETEEEEATLSDIAAEDDGVYQSGSEEEAELSEEAKLFIGNLPYDFHSQDLAMLFEKAGVVEIAEVIYNRQTDQSRGFGFVTMSTVEEAEKAVEMFNRYDVKGRLLTVNKAAPKGSQPERPPREFEPGFRIYVGNLPWDVDNARLDQVFSEHGKVANARVVFDRETGRSRGFGFVTMVEETEMNEAIAALDGQSLDGRAIRVNAAEERPRREF